MILSNSGTLSDATTDRIAALNLEQLQSPTIALLHFSAIEQLMPWLENQS
jgi:hypothetical protein